VDKFKLNLSQTSKQMSSYFGGRSLKLLVLSGLEGAGGMVVTVFIDIVDIGAPSVVLLL